jgi:3-deoxy-7-phosphoheptulonate synthase
LRKKNLDKNTKIWQELTAGKTIIAGPCSVENKEQISLLGDLIADMGLRFLRGGSYKPRTNPTSFQGLGAEAVQLLREVADRHNLFTVTEVLDTEQLVEHYDKIDMIQIGSRNMASYGFLKHVGNMTAKDNKPVLLKRGFASTLNELLMAAEYIRNAGNPNVVLCLRGIRTFEQVDSLFRFTPDLGSIIELKAMTDMPVYFDPSHAAGKAEYVPALAKAALAMGADGLMIETHHEPQCALSDGMQSILPEVLREIVEGI